MTTVADPDAALGTADDGFSGAIYLDLLKIAMSDMDKDQKKVEAVIALQKYFIPIIGYAADVVDFLGLNQSGTAVETIKQARIDNAFNDAVVDEAAESYIDWMGRDGVDSLSDQDRALIQIISKNIISNPDKYPDATDATQDWLESIHDTGVTLSDGTHIPAPTAGAEGLGDFTTVDLSSEEFRSATRAKVAETGEDFHVPSMGGDINPRTGEPYTAEQKAAGVGEPASTNVLDSPARSMADQAGISTSSISQAAIDGYVIGGAADSITGTQTYSTDTVASDFGGPDHGGGPAGYGGVVDGVETVEMDADGNPIETPDNQENDVATMPDWFEDRPGWVDPLVKAGINVFGGWLGAHAADQAADVQAQAALTQMGAQIETAQQYENKQLDYLGGIKDDQVGIYGPAMAAHGGSLAAMMAMTGVEGEEQQVRYDDGGNVVKEDVGIDAYNQNLDYDWKTDPGYQFRLEQGQMALERSAAAGSGARGGASLKGAIEYGQEFASQEYQNVYNRLGTLAGYGQVGTTGAANAIGQQGLLGSAAISQSASEQTQALTGFTASAAAKAQGYTGAANAWGGAIKGLAEIYGGLTGDED